MSRCVPLPAPKSCGRGCQPLPAVPSVPFLTTSTGSSAGDRVGLLHPTTDHGVHLVACRPPTSPPPPDISHRRYTLRSFPLPTKWTPSPSHCWLVHRMPGPSRDWPSFVLRNCRSRPALRKAPPPQGFPDRKSVAHQPRCRVWFTRYSLGLFSDSGLSPIAPAGSTNRPKSPALCSSPDRSRAPPDRRPA
jgi:hypothetical protein